MKLLKQLQGRKPTQNLYILINVLQPKVKIGEYHNNHNQKKGNMLLFYVFNRHVSSIYHFMMIQ